MKIPGVTQRKQKRLSRIPLIMGEAGSEIGGLASANISSQRRACHGLGAGPNQPVDI